MTMEKVLEVKDLRISFDTFAGKVNAIRGVSFDLYKRMTLRPVVDFPLPDSPTNPKVSPSKI